MESNKKIKILYLVTLSELGGAQRYIVDLAVNLKDKFEITVAAGGNNKLFSQLEKNGIRNVKLKKLIREINPFKDFAALIEIYMLVKKEKPTIIHLNSSKAGILGAFAGKLAGIKKIIYTVHGFVFNEPMPIWKKKFYIWLEKISAYFKNKLICVSEFDRQEGLRHKIAVAEKLITINNGIDIKVLNFLPKEEAKRKLITGYRLPITGYLVGTIANLYPTKGLLYFIQAAKKVTEINPDVHFIIIGDGEQRKELEAEIQKLGLSNNFHLLGAIKNAASYLKAFDIYVCSSVKEGFPYSILEAMAAELPIIATKVGGIPEMIKEGKNGLLVESKKPTILAETILHLINNPNIANNLSRGAERIVAEKFNINNLINQTITIYNHWEH